MTLPREMFQIKVIVLCISFNICEVMSKTSVGSSLGGTVCSLGKLCLLSTDFLDSVHLLLLGDFTQIPVFVFFIAVVLFNFKYASIFKLPKEYKEYPYTVFAYLAEVLFHWIPSNILIATFVAMHRSLYRYFINLDVEEEHSGTADWIKNKVTGMFVSQIETPERIEMPTYPFLITMAISVYTLVAVAMNRPATLEAS